MSPQKTDHEIKEELVDTLITTSLKGINAIIQGAKGNGLSKQELEQQVMAIVKRALNSKSLAKVPAILRPIAERTVRTKAKRLGIDPTKGDVEEELSHEMIKQFEVIFIQVLDHGYFDLFREMLRELSVNPIFKAKGGSRSEIRFNPSNPLAYLYAAAAKLEHRQRVDELLGDYNNKHRNRAFDFLKKLRTAKNVKRSVRDVILKDLDSDQIAKLELVIASFGKGLDLKGDIADRLLATLLHTGKLIEKKHQE